MSEKDTVEVYHVTYTYKVEIPESARGEHDAERYARNKGELIQKEAEKVDERGALD